MKPFGCFFVIVSLFSWMPVAAQAKVPPTPAGKRLIEFLAALEASDGSKVRAFVKTFAKEFLDQIPESEHIEVLDGVRGRTGGFDVVKIVESGEHEITVIAKARKTGAFRQIQLGTESAPPFGVAGIGIREAPAPGENDSPSPTGPAKSDSELISNVEKYLDELVKADRFSGVVLIAKDDKPIFRRAYGLANREYNVPNREDTKFRIGSLNKLLTEIAVGKLVEQGKLSLDDTIGRHLPDYPNKDAAQKVTIRHLLTMTSGIGDIFGRKYRDQAKDRLRTLQDFFPMFAGEPLAFEPGTKRMYSNGGFIVLGAIIEKATGQSYYDYVREHVCRPLGMTNTDHLESDAIVPNRASGYMLQGDSGGVPVFRNTLFSESWRGSSAGGGYSTADDLLKLARAISDRTVSLPGLLGQAGPSSGKPAFAAAGGSPGVSALLAVNAAKSCHVVVLANLDEPIAEDVAGKIQQWLGR